MPTMAPSGIVMEPLGLKYEYPAKKSMREAGASAAAGFEGELDESWARRLREPSPKAHTTKRIRLREIKGRECMRLSSATILFWKSLTDNPSGRAQAAPFIARLISHAIL